LVTATKLHVILGILCTENRNRGFPITSPRLVTPLAMFLEFCLLHCTL
jgi:hypothetical protein